jgi:antitoxin FitA
MASLTIRDLDDTLKQSLRIRAAHRNRSMEEEARQILRAALLDSPAPETDLAQRIRARFKGLGDVVLPPAEREPVRPPPAFDTGAAPARKTARRKPAA